MEFTTLMSGSAGNCVYVSGGKNKILIDVGCSCRYLEKGLAQIGVNLSEINAILISHEHSDHISGVPVTAKRYDIPVFASELTWEKLPFHDDFLSWNKHKFAYGMEIGDLGIEFFKTYHDAVQPVGMVVHHHEQKVAFATDTGQATPSMAKVLRGCDGIVMEANHSFEMLQNGPYPYFLKKRISGKQGHLSNTQSAKLLSKIITDKTQAVLLAHLSETNNTAERAFAEIEQSFMEETFTYSCELTVAQNRAVSPLIKLI